MLLSNLPTTASNEWVNGMLRSVVEGRGRSCWKFHSPHPPPFDVLVQCRSNGWLNDGCGWVPGTSPLFCHFRIYSRSSLFRRKTTSSGRSNSFQTPQSTQRVASSHASASTPIHPALSQRPHLGSAIYVLDVNVWSHQSVLHRNAFRSSVVRPTMTTGGATMVRISRKAPTATRMW